MRSETFTLTAARSRAGDFLTLAKPGLNSLVVATTLGGYYMATGRDGVLGTMLVTGAGTALVAGGSAAFNQLLERDADARMHRTRNRPLPDGRLQLSEATLFGSVLSIAGLIVLAMGANLMAATVALATLLTYAVVYTPLKSRTSLSTVVGAIPGALPPVIGWAAGGGPMGLAALALFAIGFCWQLPHFLAIAWIYRDDYARAGFPMLPVLEPDGRSTARQTVAYSAALLPASLAPAALGMAGTLYAIGAVLLGVFFLALAVRFSVARTVPSARALFFGSLLYLPALWALMIANRI